MSTLADSMDMSRTIGQILAYARKQNLPIIPIQAKNVQLLDSPEIFYDHLLSSVRHTKKRLGLSSLYLGTGEKEEFLVRTVCDKLQANPNLRVRVAIDANRGGRADRDGLSSITMLQKASLFKGFELGLVGSLSKPSILMRLLSPYQRLNELSSTYHAKFTVADEDVILTGANLSHIYFDKRQDRYMVIKQTKILSDYLYGLMAALCNSMSGALNTVRQYNSSFCTSQASSDLEQVGTFVIPIVQHGPSGLVDCDSFIELLNSILPDSADVHLSSGYFNPPSSLAQLKLKTVIGPSEEANGFYQGGGLLRYVPKLYAVCYKRFMDIQNECKIALYDRPDWSYHAKGLWIEGVDDTLIHLVGSSNFNVRSSKRDLEIQFVLITRDKFLKEKLMSERKSLWIQSSEIHEQHLSGLNFFHSFFAQVLKSLL